MIERHDIKCAIEQARKASIALKSLLSGEVEPPVSDVEATLSAGAQVEWMSTRGTHQSEHAFLIAAKRGFASTIEVLAKYEHATPSKGKSIFEHLIVASIHNKMSLDTFRNTVCALLKVGYSWEEENHGKCTALEVAFSNHMTDHAKILIELGGWNESLKPEQQTEILKRSLLRGCANSLWDASSDTQKEFLTTIWWDTIGGLSYGLSKEDRDLAVAKGQEIAPLTHEMCEKSLNNHRLAVLVAARHGYRPEPMAPEIVYQENSPLQPVWRCEQNSDWVGCAIEYDVPLSVLNLEQHDTQNGNDWLLHQILKEGVLAWEDYRPLKIKPLVDVLHRLKQEGLWNPGHRDAEGKTAAWHIAHMESTSPKSHRLLCWDLIEEFDLLQYPVQAPSGNLVCPWDDPRTSRGFEKPGDPLWLEGEKAKWGFGELAQNTTPTVRPPIPRRM